MLHLSLQMSSPLFFYCNFAAWLHALNFRYSVLVPILKGNKDATDSSNYCPIALSSTFSKIVQRLILSRYESVFATTSLQFGFKPDSSTSLCIATIKNIIARYLHNGSPVLGCFLDASKAFDLVDHDILFEALMKRGLPLAIIRFLLSWYKTKYAFALEIVFI